MLTSRNIFDIKQNVGIACALFKSLDQQSKVMFIWYIVTSKIYVVFSGICIII